jgi:hypothetical protein
MRQLEAQKLTVETGDFLCLYTGFTDPILEMSKTPDGEVLPAPAPCSTGAMQGCSTGSRRAVSVLHQNI